MSEYFHESVQFLNELAAIKAELINAKTDIDAIKHQLDANNLIEIEYKGRFGLIHKIDVIGQEIGKDIDDEVVDAEFSHPFRIVISTNDAGDTTWMVDSTMSTITNGTNGDPIDLTAAGFDAEEPLADNGKLIIYLEGTLGAGGSFTEWSIQSTNEISIDEVILDVGGVQTGVNLIIGSVEFFQGTGEAVVLQAINDAQLLDDAFLNGSLVKVFLSHPVHPDFL